MSGLYAGDDACTCGHHRPDSTWGHAADCRLRSTQPTKETYTREQLLGDYPVFEAGKALAPDEQSWQARRPGITDDARECIQAADDLLRQHYWGEFRERLLGDEAFEVAITAICRPGTAGGMIGRTQSVLAALAALDTTTQQEGQ